MTIQDLKKSGALRDCTHCLAPSTASNRSMEDEACANGGTIIRPDASYAFPHMKLQMDQIYVKCPEEVYNHPEIPHKMKEKGIDPFWNSNDELVLE
eukprot:6952778-Alexandrium_andersonii.AAC.1